MYCCHISQKAIKKGLNVMRLYFQGSVATNDIVTHSVRSTVRKITIAFI